MKIFKNKKLGEYTTYKIGGPADFFVDAKTEDDIISATDFARKRKIPMTIIGNGSNILINDKGFRGLIIKVSNTGCSFEENAVTCQAGTPIAFLINEALKRNLGGLEFLSGIPGTISGALVGNAGMGDKWISDAFIEAKIIQPDGNIKKIGSDYCNFDYRDSTLKESQDTVLEVTLRLEDKEKKKILNNIKKYSEKRKNQPKGYSCGSVFRNPDTKKAGQLIEKAGLKGATIGGAMISQDHANFIINKGEAKAEDIIALIKLVEKEVKDKFGVQLKRELRMLNEQSWQ
jgi:UDP-N-acetylmuramate dehydrogenase